MGLVVATRRSILFALGASPAILACGPSGLAVSDAPSGDAGAAGGAGVVPLRLVAEGDSLTGGQDSWANQLGGVLNQATPGDQLRLMLDQAPYQIDPLFEPGSIASLWGGTNDLTIFPNVTADWLLDKTSEWGLGRQAVGYRVVVFTMLPRLRWSAEQEQARLGFNQRLTEPRQGIDLVIDACGAPGSLGDGVLYRADGIHLTFEGHTWLLEQRVHPALERMS